MSRNTQGKGKSTSLVAIYAITYGNDHIKDIHHHLTRPFVRRYPNFSDSVGQMYLPTLFYLVKIVPWL